MREAQKRPRTRALLLGVLTCVASLSTSANAQVSLRLRSDAAQVRTGEPFQIEVRAESNEGRADSIVVENLDAFQVVNRQQSLSTSFSFGFGSQTQSRQTTVQTLTLIAKQSGEHAIGPAVATLGGKRFKSNQVTITASGESLAASAQSSSDPQLQAQGHAFLRVLSDKTEAFVGEQITVEATLYTRDPLAQSLTILKELQVTGAWTHNLLGDATQVEAEQVLIEQQPYYAYRFKHIAAFALGEEPVTIDGMELEGMSGQRFGLRRRLTPIHASSEPIEVKIKPFPKGVTDDSAVGTFSLEANLDRRSVVTGDAVTAHATVHGDGALATVTPQLALSDGLRALDPTVKEQLQVRSDKVGGTKSFQWIVVAERAGKHTVSVSLPVFDPASREAVTLRADTLHFEAAGLGAKPTDVDTDAESTPATERRSLPAKRSPDLDNRASRNLFTRPLSVALLTACLLLLLGALAQRWLTRRSRSRPIDPWQTVEVHIEQADDANKDEAIAHLERALRASLDAVLGAPTASMTVSDLTTAMNEAGVRKETVDEAVGLHEELEFARYSPAGGDTRALIARTKSMVRALHTRGRGRA